MDVREEEFVFASPVDDQVIAGVVWRPADDCVGVVQIAHGLAEHCRRYRRLAGQLCAAGYAVYAHDHRGHGRSLGPDDAPGDFGDGGWPALMRDLFCVTERARADAPAAPIALLGHSMGSFAVQNFLLDHADAIDACVLSGSTDLPSLAQAAMAGEDLSFAAFNKPFAPARTDFDWLSRDPAEVDAYVADPLCGFDAPTETTLAMMTPAMRVGAPEAFSRVPADLPVLILSGTEDPLARGGAFVETLAGRLRDAGLKTVDTRLYDGARHELFNETNRDAVAADLIAWLGENMRCRRGAVNG